MSYRRNDMRTFGWNTDYNAWSQNHKKRSHHNKHNYTIEDLKRHVLNLQRSGIGNDLKQSTPTGCGFKSSPV
jgi:hypothetical protein